ncbi:MAG: PPC domain-containing protein [Chloroflexi bacterium]|nr:PPC domain-containing protein [Chloroflexota bacterium]
MRKRLKTLLLGFIILPILWLASSNNSQAQANPTPVVISLTPVGEPTVTLTPTLSSGTPGLLPDRFEPNDTSAAATPLLTTQNEAGLTLIGADVDQFQIYLKTGQIFQATTTVYGGLDTRLSLYQGETLVAQNDDQSATNVGSQVVYAAASDGWVRLVVEKMTAYDGVYDLATALVAPTVTPTLLPSLTPSPTPSPSATPSPTPTPTPLVLADPAEPNDNVALAWPVTPGIQADFSLAPGDVDWFTFIAKAGTTYTCETITNQVDTVLTVHGSSGVIASNDDRASGRLDSLASWTNPSEQTVFIEVTARGGGYGLYQLLCQVATGQASFPAGGGAQPTGQATATPALTLVPTGTLTATLHLTATQTLTLAVRYVGEANPVTPTPVTPIRLLIYYDANNDRQASVSEGIANVLVLATDKLGQVVMTVFTNSQGEAVFNVTDPSTTRLVVPFVPGWSTQIRQAQANELTLGLPAVRLPVFWPVQNRVAEESR